MCVGGKGRLCFGNGRRHVHHGNFASMGRLSGEWSGKTRKERGVFGLILWLGDVLVCRAFWTGATGKRSDGTYGSPQRKNTPILRNHLTLRKGREKHLPGKKNRKSNFRRFRLQCWAQIGDDVCVYFFFFLLCTVVIIVRLVKTTAFRVINN